MKVVKFRAFGRTGAWFVYDLAARYDTTVTVIPPKFYQRGSRYEVAVPWRDEVHSIDLAIEASWVFMTAWGSGYKRWIEPSE